MDYIALAYYACVCALLSLFVSKVQKVAIRLVIGALVGLLAASALPIIKQLIGA